MTELLRTGARQLLQQAIEAESQEVLLRPKSRGMNVPQLSVGDGAMGFWAALQQRLHQKSRSHLFRIRWQLH